MPGAAFRRIACSSPIPQCCVDPADGRFVRIGSGTDGPLFKLGQGQLFLVPAHLCIVLEYLAEFPEQVDGCCCLIHAAIPGLLNLVVAFMTHCALPVKHKTKKGSRSED